MCDIQVELPEPFCLAMCKVYFSFNLFWTPTYFYYVNMWHPSRVAWALLFGNVQGLIFFWVLLNTNIFLWTHATQTYPQLGRFVMREDGATVGIGVVTSFDCDQDCARDGDSSEWQTNAVCCCGVFQSDAAKAMTTRSNGKDIVTHSPVPKIVWKVREWRAA